MSTAEAAIDPISIAEENPSRVVWILAWPAVALNSLQVVNILLDRVFVGHLSAATLTGYGGSSSVTFLMFSLGVALATGATALVARAFGAGDRPMFRTASSEALSLSIFGGTLAGLVTIIAASFAANLILPPHDQAAKLQLVRFVTAYGFGLPALFVIQALAGSLRGIGDTRSPMFISGVQILLHITLNFFFIFPTRHVGPITIPGAGLGLMGAGCALATSAWIAAIAYIVFVARTPLGAMTPWRLPHAEWALRILRIAAPAAVMASLRVFSLTAFTIVLKQVPEGSAAIGAMAMGFAVESIMFMPAFGLSAAAAALVGQSLGMKKPERAERLAWTAGHHGALVTICLAAPIFALAPSVAWSLTGGKIEIAGQTATLIRCLCVSEFLFAYAMIMLGAMQGAGDTVRPMWITIFALWGIRVPLAVVMALPAHFALGGFLPLPFALGMGATGAWIGMSFTQGIQGVLAILAFKAGHWKTAKV